MAKAPPSETRRGWLDAIERVGNALPDPAILFVIGAVLVVLLSGLGDAMGWAVTPVRVEVVTETTMDADGKEVVVPVLDEHGTPRVRLVDGDEPLRPRSLLSREGAYWAISSIVANFTGFAPLGIVLTGMLGIGVAEKTGMFGALLRWLASVTPRALMAPMLLALGMISSVGSDSGYVVLPALGAALFQATGRSPLMGVALAFAGISAGFSAGLFPSGGDALIAGITEANAQIIDKAYGVNPLCNYRFFVASLFVLTLVGWGVSAWIVEPRMSRRRPEEGGPGAVDSEGGAISAAGLSGQEKRGLVWALLALMGMGALVLPLVLIPGAALHGEVVRPNGSSVARWTQVIVPLLFFVFLAPGVAYGAATGTIRSGKDAVGAMVHAMRMMAPVIVMAFFAAQFVQYFDYSNLGRMLAMEGGRLLSRAELPRSGVLVVFVLVVMLVNMFVGSMSAKWLMLAPIFVPMFMLVGLSPELTQAAYRVGDSVTNVVTPMNTYLVIILAVMQRYAKGAGIGTIIATMLPFTLVFALVWTLMLLGWVWMGWPLGDPGPLVYPPR